MATKKPLKLTYSKATTMILDQLAVYGWEISSRHLKIPHATHPTDGYRIWFKPQATYLGIDRTLGNARSMHFDRRNITADSVKNAE